MVLTINEHLQELQDKNRINSISVQQVLAKAMKGNMPDMNDLESIQVSIMIDAMSAAHIKYPDLHQVISKNTLITTANLKQQIKKLVYPTIEAAFDPKYFPKTSEDAWLTLLVTYIDTYYERLTGCRRLDSLAPQNGEKL